MRFSAQSRVKSLEFLKGHMVVLLQDGGRLKVPVSRFPLLARASAEKRMHYALAQDHQAITWPHLPLALTLAQLQQRG